MRIGGRNVPDTIQRHLWLSLVPNFVSEVVEMPDGCLATKMMAMRENVNQALGIDPVAFAAIGLPAREVPKCEHLRICSKSDRNYAILSIALDPIPGLRFSWEFV